jgi:tetratricopeptide (TPR) repeat protein
MLETIGEFAAARLAESGEEDELRGRQIDALLRRCRLAGAHAVVYAHVRVDLALVTPELDNVRASLAWSLDRDRVRGLRLATALEEFWVIRDPTEGADWLERLLDAASDAPTRLRADALRALGGARDIVGDHERAAPAYRESVEAFEELGEELHVANLRFRIAANLLNRGEAATAAPLLDAVHAEFERLGDRRGEAQTLAYYGFKSANEGDLPTAAEFFEQSAAIVHELGWTWWEGNMEVNLAEIRRRLGQLDEAERHARRSLELAQGIGDRQDAIFAMTELAAAAALRDDSLSAGRLWGALESELDAAPVGHWPRYGGEFEAIMLGVAGTEFEQARSEGRLLTLAAAAGLEPASPDQTLP